MRRETREKRCGQRFSCSGPKPGSHALRRTRLAGEAASRRLVGGTPTLLSCLVVGGASHGSRRGGVPPPGGRDAHPPFCARPRTTKVRGPHRRVSLRSPDSDEGDTAIAMDRTKDGSGPRPRIELVDLARGTALAAMAVYHFTWDLEFFSYVDAGTTAIGGWKVFARCIASSFLFLVGVSLFLAHGDGVRWPGFGRRLAMIGGAAAAISLATWIAVPKTFIFFGILHQIALASLLGLPFLRLPWAVNLLAAAGVVAAPHFLRSGFLRPSGVVVARPVEREPALQRLCPGLPVVRRRACGHRRRAACAARRPAAAPRRARRAPPGAAAAFRRPAQPCLLPRPPAGPDRRDLAVLASCAADARKPGSAFWTRLRRVLHAGARHRLLRALLWMRARRARRVKACSMRSWRGAAASSSTPGSRR